jgi:hypothetical protein
MGEYEDRYPDAYGRDEEVEAKETPKDTHRHFRGTGLPRQVRSDPPPVVVPANVLDAPPVVTIEEPSTPSPPLRPVERPRPSTERSSREIHDDVAEQLNGSPFIDASGVSISVDGSQVTLEGTINSLMAVSLARALTTNVPGVSRVQVQLRVEPAPRDYRMVPDNAKPRDA